MSDIAPTAIGAVLELIREPIDVEPLAVYRSIGVRSFGKGIFHYEPVQGASLSKVRWFKIRPGELVISNIKGWEGAIAVSSETEIGCIASNRFLTYKPKSDRVDIRYLLYYFLSEPGLKCLRRTSLGSTDRNLTLGIKAFESLEIPLPPIDVQRCIAHKLSLVREAALRLQYCQSRNSPVVSALPSSLAQRHDLSERDKKTNGWQRLALREVMRPVLHSRAVESGHTYPNIGILNYGRGTFEKPPIDGSRTSTRTLNQIHTGQFIYSRLFAFEGAYAAVPPQFDGYFVSQEFPTFELDPLALDANFLAAYLRSPSIWDDLSRFARGLGVRRQRIHTDTLLGFEIWLPPVSIQRVVVQQLHRLQEHHMAHARAVNLVAALASAVVNKAFEPLV